jgi:hypothetical protein
MSMGVGVSYDTVTGKASMKIDYAELYRIAVGYYTYRPGSVTSSRVMKEYLQFAYLDENMQPVDVWGSHGSPEANWEYAGERVGKARDWFVPTASNLAVDIAIGRIRYRLLRTILDIGHQGIEFFADPKELE